MRKLLTPGRASPKLSKDGEEFESAILHLAPVDLAYAGRNVCPWASEGCRAACLNTSGRGQVSGALDREKLEAYPIHAARIERTRFFFDNRQGFLRKLAQELYALQKRAVKRGKKAVVRLNGTSDLPFESFRFGGRANIMEAFPALQFYDYTKGIARALRSVTDLAWLKNYHLTFSNSGAVDRGTIESILQAGVNVAVVFDRLPETRRVWRETWKVIDGTVNDWRFKDPTDERGAAVIVGLLPKGRAKHDMTGFVVRHTGAP